MLHLIHTQLPWYATLPLSAFILRGFLTVVFGVRVRASTARYIGLQPLRQAMAFQIKDKLMKTGGFKTPKEAKLTISRAVYRRTQELDKKWRCSLSGQLGWTFLQLPVFLTMAELVRQMCNTRSGLLGMAFNAFGLGKDQTSFSKLEQGMDPAIPATSGMDMLPQSAGMETMGVETMGMSSTSWFFEPTLANEGMLWFPNLLIPDPTGTLPFVVSALMFTNVWVTNNTPDVVGKMARSTVIIRRILLGVSLMIGPLCQEVPAAMLLYWASSTSSVLLWNLWLDKRFPALRGWGACKRPLMMVLPTKSVQMARQVSVHASTPKKILMGPKKIPTPPRNIVRGKSSKGSM
jgi:inner membrane protein COX18